MSQITLEQAVTLAADVPSTFDDRPEWLRSMASASDTTALYYRFFHELGRRHRPLNVCEIGTYVGTSAAHLAHANDGGRVVTVDMNPDAKRRADALKIPNLTAVCSDSMEAVRLTDVTRLAPFDVLFIDGLHNFNQTWGEYVAYRPLVREGGLIFFDDLSLDMSTREMHAFWDLVPETKARLDGLHYTGFGVVKKDGLVAVPSWTEIVGRARDRMRELGGIVP